MCGAESLSIICSRDYAGVAVSSGLFDYKANINTNTNTRLFNED